MKKGKLFVFEGIDGSGKTTQVELLKKFLHSKRLSCETISFPRYGENKEANLVADYLRGNLGNLFGVDPFLLAKAYAGDRLLAKPLIEGWLKEGKMVIVNRYVSSSKAHLGANLDEEKRAGFMRWVDELEYQTNGIPKPDLTILLDVDPLVGQKNASKDHKVDIHEKDIEHESQASKIYLELSQAEENWVILDCMENGQMKPKEEIHKELLQVLEGKIF